MIMGLTTTDITTGVITAGITTPTIAILHLIHILHSIITGTVTINGIIITILIVEELSW
jgi:hypothetical protein